MAEIDNPNELDAAIRVVKQAGYVVEAAGPYRERERRLQERAASNQAQNRLGQWVPAIPEPLFLALGRVSCDCGERFRGRRRYREHYALAHILALD